MSTRLELSADDSVFLRYFRGWSMICIVFSHLCGWVWPPYSSFFFAPYVPAFFAISGAVSYYSFIRSYSGYAYVLKKIIQLLVPYYLFSFFCLVFYSLNNQVPDFSMYNLWLWLSIRPGHDLMPFPFGQIWFLHALIAISFMSYFIFKLIDNNIFILSLLIFILFISIVQFFIPIYKYLIWNGRNLYQPFIFLLFFIFGCLFFSYKISKKMLSYIMFFSFVFLCLIAILLDTELSPSRHSYSPDMYYVSLSLFSLSFFFFYKEKFVSMVNVMNICRDILLFFDKHTFSVFLIHSFSIFITEEYFGLVNPQGGFILYAFKKAFLVFFITCLSAIPFSFLTKYLTSSILYYLKYNKYFLVNFNKA